MAAALQHLNHFKQNNFLQLHRLLRLQSPQFLLLKPLLQVPNPPQLLILRRVVLVPHVEGVDTPAGALRKEAHNRLPPCALLQGLIPLDLGGHGAGEIRAELVVPSTMADGMAQR